MSQWIEQSGLSWTDRDADQWVGGLTWEAESLPLTLSVNEHIGAATTRILTGVLDMQLLLKQAEVEILQDVFPDSISLSSQLNDPELRISTQISASKQHINAFVLPATAREAEVVFPHLIQAVLRLRNPIIFSDVYLEPASMELSLDINEAFYAGDFQIFSLDAPIGDLNTTLIEPWPWVTSNVGVDSISVNLNMQQASVEHDYTMNASALPLTLSLKPSTHDLSFTWVASSLPLSFSLEESTVITGQWFSAALLELDTTLNVPVVWNDYIQDIEVLELDATLNTHIVWQGYGQDTEVLGLDADINVPAIWNDYMQEAVLLGLDAYLNVPVIWNDYMQDTGVLGLDVTLNTHIAYHGYGQDTEVLELNADLNVPVIWNDYRQDTEVLELDAVFNMSAIWNDYMQDAEVLSATINIFEPASGEAKNVLPASQVASVSSLPIASQIIEAEVDVSPEYDAELFELSTSMLEPANIQFAELFELSTSMLEPANIQFAKLFELSTSMLKPTAGEAKNVLPETQRFGVGILSMDIEVLEPTNIQFAKLFELSTSILEPTAGEAKDVLPETQRFEAGILSMNIEVLEPVNIQFAELFELSISVSEPAFSWGYEIFCETLSARLELKGVSVDRESTHTPELLELNADMKEIVYASEMLREYEVLKGDITKELILDTKIDIKGHMYA